MGDFGIVPQGFELEVAVMKSLPALFRVFQEKIQAILTGVEYVPPSKCYLWLIGQSVLYYDQIVFFSDHSLLFEVFIGLDEITVKIRLEPPEYFDRGRHKIDKLVSLATS